MVQNLILPKRSIAEGIVAGVNNTDVAFVFTADVEGNPIPVGFRVTGVSVIPHDGADPKVAVATVWRLRLYRKYAKAVDDLVYEDTRYGLPASSDPSLDSTPWDFLNQDGSGGIYGTIGIENGATDCSFSIGVSFERR